MDQSSVKIDPSWLTVLEDEFKKPYFASLKSFLEEERTKGRIFPPGNRIFAAFNYTPFDKVKAVIIGQDPYHGFGQANGLCFSVADGIRKPPSLVNIFKEIQDDLGIPVPESGNLEKWAEQGVLLLNATLTVREGAAGSHQGKGWEQFTDTVIKTVSDQKEGVVFLLWGNYAKAKEALIDGNKHTVLSAPHPSPLARGGFFGCKHFSRTNAILEKEGKKPINWSTV
ncbi:MAG: uracil-DNA glycosylase [Bacteroidetes bacterium]|jgi:uracil-DNA glycosylase|nr:uracil-DNA glycosylase [Bacteroidota bacterium]